MCWRQKPCTSPGSPKCAHSCGLSWVRVSGVLKEVGSVRVLHCTCGFALQSRLGGQNRTIPVLVWEFECKPVDLCRGSLEWSFDLLVSRGVFLRGDVAKSARDMWDGLMCACYEGSKVAVLDAACGKASSGKRLLGLSPHVGCHVCLRYLFPRTLADGIVGSDFVS